MLKVCWMKKYARLTQHCPAGQPLLNFDFQGVAIIKVGHIAFETGPPNNGAPAQPGTPVSMYCTDSTEQLNAFISVTLD